MKTDISPKLHGLSRKSDKNEYGKKGGAGGKGTWGAPGDEARFHQTINRSDPNYDPDETEPFTLDEIQPRRTRNELKKIVDENISMFLELGDQNRYSNELRQLTNSMFRFYIVRKSVSLGLHDKDWAVKNLVTDRRLISQEHLERGLEDCFQLAKDWELDSPGSLNKLKAFVKSLEDKEYIASVFLPSQLYFLENQTSIKSKISDELQEFFTSLDIDEFVKFVVELKCRPAHAYVIKYIFKQTLEQSNAKIEFGARLLVALSETSGTGPITILEFMRGIELALIESEDILIDHPNGQLTLSQLIARVVVDECLPPAFFDSVLSLREDAAGSQILNQAKEVYEGHSVSATLHTIWAQEKSLEEE
eukprot:c12772_g1_i1.p1 GENE.c12772_g1_i1~~c12772_g1_i1.p1  ORF type:complete len:363 (+),score=152.85 c12772_g1_i1:556-1644(+)